MLPRRGTVVTRWICFVQAPGSIPGGETHPIFRFVEEASHVIRIPHEEPSHVSKEADGNPLAC